MVALLKFRPVTSLVPFLCSGPHDITRTDLVGCITGVLMKAKRHVHQYRIAAFQAIVRYIFSYLPCRSQDSDPRQPHAQKAMVR